MIVVTGATGMLGGHLLWHLLQENEELTGLRRPSSNLDDVKWIFRFYGDQEEHLFSKIRWVNADLEDRTGLEKIFQGADYVYHCAAMVDLGKNGEEMMRINAEGTRHVAEAALAAGIKKLCFVSSTSALAPAREGEKIDEKEPTEALPTTSAYGESKRRAEAAVKDVAEKGLNYVTVNPSVILGYSKKMSGSGELFKRVKAGLPFYTNGMNGYVAVEDVAKAMILLTKSDISGERFLISGADCTHKEILSLMAKGYGKTPPHIGMNRSLLLAVASLSEAAGKLFRFKPLLDRSSAKTALSRQQYNTAKLQAALPGFSFTPISRSIAAICKFDKANP